MAVPPQKPDSLTPRESDSLVPAPWVASRPGDRWLIHRRLTTRQIRKQAVDYPSITLGPHATGRKRGTKERGRR